MQVSVSEDQTLGAALGHDVGGAKLAGELRPLHRSEAAGEARSVPDNCPSDNRRSSSLRADGRSSGIVSRRMAR
jgi:hypothetical protein